jgi:hypothetical protein
MSDIISLTDIIGIVLYGVVLIVLYLRYRAKKKNKPEFEPILV